MGWSPRYGERLRRSLPRRLSPARLFTPSEDDQALAWALISERLAEAHRQHVLAGNTPLSERERQQVARLETRSELTTPLGSDG